jgi:hypothetical protein
VVVVVVVVVVEVVVVMTVCVCVCACVCVRAPRVCISNASLHGSGALWYMRVVISRTKEGVSVGSLDLKHALLHLKDRHIERATTEVVHCDDLVGGLVHAVSEGGGRGLVDHTKDRESCDLACVLCCLTLRVVEVRGDGDDGVLDLVCVCVCVCVCARARVCVCKQLLTVVPRYASAVSFIFVSTNELICEGEYSLPCASTHASPFFALMILNDAICSGCGCAMGMHREWDVGGAMSLKVVDVLKIRNTPHTQKSFVS